jgi:hypothetical protein
MKPTKEEKLAHRIYLSSIPRIEELVIKFLKGNYNNATLYAFQLGLESDITGKLKGKLK